MVKTAEGTLGSPRGGSKREEATDKDAAWAPHSYGYKVHELGRRC